MSYSPVLLPKHLAVYMSAPKEHTHTHPTGSISPCQPRAPKITILFYQPLILTRGASPGAESMGEEGNASIFNFSYTSFFLATPKLSFLTVK